MIYYAILLFGIVPLSIALLYVFIWTMRFMQEWAGRLWFTWLERGFLYTLMWIVVYSFQEALGAIVLRFRGFDEEICKGKKWVYMYPFQYKQTSEEENDEKEMR